MQKIARALLSVSDKTGLVDFARGLSAQGVELISTGGTAKALRDAGLKVIDVAEITQVPEMMDGRVKTLHPKIHGGLLAVRGKESHEQALKDHDIPKIDLLAVNLYPFESTAAAVLISRPASRRSISRAGADPGRRPRTTTSVVVVVDPADYSASSMTWSSMAARPRQSCPNSSRPRPSPAPPPMTPPSRGWFAETSGENSPERRVVAGACADATLRREPASGRRLLRHGTASASPRRAGAGQGAVVQQSQRHGSRPNCRRVRRTRRSRSSSTSTRAGGGAAHWRRPMPRLRL